MLVPCLEGRLVCWPGAASWEVLAALWPSESLACSEHDTGEPPRACPESCESALSFDKARGQATKPYLLPQLVAPNSILIHSLGYLEDEKDLEMKLTSWLTRAYSARWCEKLKPRLLWKLASFVPL